MHDLGARIVSTLLLSGVLLFVAFFLFSILYPRKVAAASPAGAGPAVASRPKDYGYLAPVARPLEWTLRQVEARVDALGLTVVAECTLAGGANLPEEKWREFYFPVIGDRPPCLEGTSKYMAYGPVKVIHLRGEAAIQKVRKAVGATRPTQAGPGTIRGDFCPGAVEANVPYRLKFQQPGDDQFLFNMIHASDSEKSFAREIQFFRTLNWVTPAPSRVSLRRPAAAAACARGIFVRRGCRSSRRCRCKGIFPQGEA